MKRRLPLFRHRGAEPGFFWVWSALLSLFENLRHGRMGRIGGAAGALHRRKRFVEELAEGTRSRAELAEALDVSPATVSRATALLDEAGLVSASEGSVSLTVAGEAAWESYRRLSRSLRSLEEAAGGLERFPDDLPEELLVRADYVETEPLRELLDVVRDSRTYRAVLGSPRWEMVKVYRERALAGTDLELVATGDISERLVDHFGDAVGEAMGSGNFRLHAIDGEVPTDLHLSVADRGVRVVTELQGEKRRVEGLGVSRSREAREAFLDEFERARERGEEVSL